MNKTLNDIGKDGFYWFLGIIENRIPRDKNVNEVQIRIFGSHSEKRSELATKDLPWARVFGSTNSRSESHDLQEGDLVFGFYLDGEQSQEPAILSTIISNDGGQNSIVDGFTDPRESFDNFPKLQENISDSFVITNKNRENNSLTATKSQLSNSRSSDVYTTSFVKKVKDKVIKFLKKGQEFQVNQTHANSKYPFNRSRETESGHLIEYDDTPGAERILIMHRTGSYYEIDNNGDMRQINKNSTNVNINSRLDVIKEKCDISVGKELAISADSIDMHANKYININAAIATLNGNLRVTNNLYVESAASGSFLTMCGKIVTVTNGIVVNIK